MRGLAWVPVLAFLAACGGGGGAGAPDVPAPADAADVPATPDVADPGTDAAVVPGDTPAEAAPDLPGDPGATDPGIEVGPNAGCVGDVCAAGPDHVPDPAAWGPFPVGVRTITFVDKDRTNPDGSPRTLRTEIWYPTTEEYRDKPKFAYDMKLDAPPDVVAKLQGVDVGVFPVDAVLDAPVRSGDGRFPLIAFSHGAYGIRFQSVFLTVRLASHGYIVFSPDHEGNTLYDMLLKGYDASTLPDSALRRPGDVEFLIDRFAAKDSDPADPFYHAVDADRIGVAGHSFGGYTCYVVADEDKRVKAILPLAPAASAVGFVGIILEDWAFPTLMMGGELDNTLDFVQYMKDPWDSMKPPKWFLDIKRGGHYTFTDICKLNLQDLVKKLGWVDAGDALEDGCAPTNWDAEKAHDAVNVYSIAFLNAFVRDSPGSIDYLDADTGKPFGAEVEFTAVPK